MREVHTLENESEHEHDVNKIDNEDEGVVELSCSELCACNVVEDVAEEPVSEGEHCDVDGEEEESRGHEGQHVHQI